MATTAISTNKRASAKTKTAARQTQSKVGDGSSPSAHRIALVVEKAAMVLISAGALAQALGHTDLAALLLGVGGACGVSGGK